MIKSRIKLYVFVSVSITTLKSLNFGYEINLCYVKSACEIGTSIPSELKVSPASNPCRTTHLVCKISLLSSADAGMKRTPMILLSSLKGIFFSSTAALDSDSSSKESQPFPSAQPHSLRKTTASSVICLCPGIAHGLDLKTVLTDSHAPLLLKLMKACYQR